MGETPTRRLLRGTLGKPSLVLSLPDIRNAEILTQTSVFQTADGDVTGRVGDIAITAYGGERYPIARQIFFGAYELLGQVDHRLIARRLIHIRIAWPVLSEDAEFDYGAGRGVTSVAKGGWLYQSDEDDFGVINPEVKLRGHVDVGDAEVVARSDWRARFESILLILTCLPPLLTLLALMAMEAPELGAATWVSSLLIATELALLLAGVACAVWTRAQRWNLKAAVSAGVNIGASLQLAPELLGVPPSMRFPNMTLWRAAQMEPDRDAAQALRSPETKARLASLRERIAQTLEDMRGSLARCRRTERIATSCEIAAILIVVLGNGWLIVSPHHTLLELVAVWLPSLIGALHTLSYRERTAERVDLLGEFIRQLSFIKTQLQAVDCGNGAEVGKDGRAIEAALRLLCRIVGQYCQLELRSAIAQQPQLPV